MDCRKAYERSFEYRTAVRWTDQLIEESKKELDTILESGDLSAIGMIRREGLIEEALSLCKEDKARALALNTDPCEFIETVVRLINVELLKNVPLVASQVGPYISLRYLR
jgi:hypothetical protein